MNALRFFHLVDDFLKIGLRDFHNHVGIHLNKSAVGVVSESGIACLFSESFYCNVVKTKV